MADKIDYEQKCKQLDISINLLEGENKRLREQKNSVTDSDTISRQAAIDALRMCYDTETITMDNGDEYIDYGDAVNEIEQLPPAQPKRGKWIKISPANIYECSECGKHVMTNDICAYDFCHGCGADMRGELK